MSYRRPSRDGRDAYFPAVTYAVAAASVALTFLWWSAGRPDGAFGEVSLERIWSGDYGGLITPTLLHGDVLHILFNLLWLTRLGPLVERHLGRLEYVVFLAVAALVGTGIEIAATSHDSIGLSGVVYALWGLCWAARRANIGFQMVSTRETAQWMLGWLVLSAGLTAAGQMNVATGAHLGGLAFGVAIGWLFVDRDTAPRFRALGGGLLALLAVLTTLAATYLPWSGRWQSWRIAAHEGAAVVAPR